jgi:tetratricopeptide (TPR) repeat protein
MQGGRRSRDSKDLKAIDSLRMRAFRFDPFLYRRFDRAMIIAYYRDENRMAFGTASAAELDRAIIDYLESAGPSTRAWMFYSEGRLDQALVEYNHAIERSKAPGYLRIDKARTLVMQGMNKLALEELTRALEDLRKKEDDKDEDVRFYDSKALVEHGIGILYGKLGDADSAKAALGRAMTEDLSYFAAHVELGRLALEEKDTVTAVSELGLAAELATDEPWVHYLQGSTLVATGNPTDAIAPLRKAIAMEPLYAAPQFALGQALEATGDAAGAKTAYENFLSMAPRRDAQRAIASDRLAALGGGDKK